VTWSNSKDPIVFVVPGDLHLTETGLDNHRVACWTIDEANRLIRPDFVQFIGDNVQHASDEQFRLFCGLASRLAVPYFALVGDHDLDGVGTPGRFMNYLGAPYGSTALAGFRFVRLNSQEARPVGFSEFQLDWLEEEFAMAQIAKQRVVLFQHNYPYKVFEEFAGPGVDRWRRIVDEHRVVAIFCGHTHYAQTANDGRNVTIAARSIGDPEGGPPGYLVGFVQGDDLAVKYRTVEDSNSLVLITHPRDALLATSSRHIVRGPDWVRVRTWSLDPLLGVQWRLDDGAWNELQPQTRELWEAPLADGELLKGEHTIEVAARERSGEVMARDAATFVFDPTGRYTPLPMVRPIVKKTAFC
jgi:3',5'-cyclic AMP phosphodiesterase CpdA